ncbi:MAG: hypothetical protein DRG78_13860 [Epsilonproteobacteria bacterium]|nr:MAG: hypothetical protein DRG78_13860 [Campylobacterota bacterium]
MNYKIYYLPINSTSLSHYISKAIMLPSRFYTNRPLDIQSEIGDYILLSNKKIINNTDCSIEVVINNEENKNYIEATDDPNIFIYKRPIPISRIKSLSFIDELQKTITLSQINRGAGFIPEILANIIVKENNDSIDISKVINIKNFKYNAELETEIKTYNQILGGIAFMRFSIFNNEYSSNYFSTLSFFNKIIEEKYKINNKDIYTGLIGAFTGNGSKMWTQLYPLIYEDIINKDVEDSALRDNINIEKSNGIFKYELLAENHSLTYKLAILNIYGKGKNKRKSIEDLILDFKNGKIPEDKIEGISLIFGINSGYSNFYNQYTLNGIKKIVKFKLNSQFDYYTIESIFQYIFNDKKENRKFEYIDEWCPNNNVKNASNIFEEIVIKEQNNQILSLEYLQNILQQDLKVSEIIKKVFHDTKKEVNNYELNSIVEEKDEIIQDLITNENQQKIASIESKSTVKEEEWYDNLEKQSKNELIELVKVKKIKTKAKQKKGLIDAIKKSLNTQGLFNENIK